MIIKVNGYAIQVEGVLFNTEYAEGQLGILNVDIFNYSNYLNPNSSYPAIEVYVHEEIPLLLNNKLYILEDFYCTGLNSRYKHGICNFKKHKEININKLEKHFDDKDLIFMESLKGINKYKL